MKIPQIIIIEQLTPGHERFANDKVQKDVGVCVKKKGFPIVLSTENKNLDFTKVNLSVSLLYDNNNEPVDFIEQVPLTYKTKLSQEKKKAIIDITILVLSSQMENSLFKIKIRAENKKDKNDFVECLSMPLKVVSKVSQLNAKAKKRTRNRSTPTKDMFITAMETLDKGQEKHSLLLATLLEQSKLQTQILQVLLQEETNDIVNTINNDSTILQDTEKESASDSSSKKRKITDINLNNNDFNNGKSSPVNIDFVDGFSFAFDNLIESFNGIQDDIGTNNVSFTSSPLNLFESFESKKNSPYSFEEEVIFSESPNVNNSDLSEDNTYLNQNDKDQIVNNSIDFGVFPNLFIDNNYL